MKRLLAVSNGHGEDDIAIKILDALAPLAPDLQIEAWPMVGDGARYRARNIPVSGPANTLPGEGFGTLSLAAFLRDLRHGFIATHWRQYRHARALAGRFDLLLGVGDVVPLAVARLSRTPMAFVACAKSAYYAAPDGHTWLERHLMRRHCAAVFARDALTAQGFAATGVPACHNGNPMMDGLGPDTALWPGTPGETALLMLPGSRADAADNARLLLEAAARISGAHPAPAELRFLFALPPSLPPQSLADAPGWQVTASPAPFLRLSHPGGARAELAQGSFGPMARAVQRAGGLAVGLAGTANEQAIGLGLPLITLPGAGNQGAAYVRMKMRFFGPAAQEVAHDPDEVAQAALGLLADPGRRARMGAAGRARMGGPGASAAIAARLVELLESGP